MRNFAWIIAIAALSPACAATSDADSSGGNVGFGGAQDIGQLRQILDEGGIPGEATLDANGFFSEHYTELPPPDCGQIMCLHGMLAVGRDWLGGEYQAALQIAMSTTVDPAAIERLPLNLVVVVDTSGSMALDNRIEFARQGLHLLIDQLEDGDRLALVRYSGDVQTLAVPGALDRQALHGAVEDIVAQGSTNIYGGLEAGLALARESFDPGRQNRVVLLSDGLATTGITDDDSILEMAVGYIAHGIGLTTIGVGREFNVALMRGLAERGAGNFYFLEGAAAVREVFVDELDYFVTPLAVSVEIEVASGPAYDLGEVVGTRLWKSRGSSGSIFIPGVFVASRTGDSPEPGGRRGGGGAIIIAMMPRQGVFERPREVAEIRMSYRLPGSEETLQQVVAVTNPADPGVAPDDDVFLSHQAMAEHYAAYNVFLGLRQATRSAQYHYDCALAELRALDGEIERWNLELGDDDIAADRALVQQFIGNLEALGAGVRDGIDVNACSGGGGFIVDEPAPYPYACALAGHDSRGAAQLALVLAALALILRRRPRPRAR